MEEWEVAKALLEGKSCDNCYHRDVCPDRFLGICGKWIDAKEDAKEQIRITYAGIVDELKNLGPRKT